MGFFGGFLLGRESASGKNNEGGGIISSILYIFILIGFYKWIEDMSVQYFGNKIIQLFIFYLLISIFLYRYNDGKGDIGITVICLVVELVNVFLCVILGFTFFNKIGYTPFSFLIDCFNILNWGTHNSLSEIIGELIWIVLFALHVLIKPLGFMIVQRYIIKRVKYNKQFKTNQP